MAERVRRRVTTGKVVYVGRNLGNMFVTYRYIARKVTADYTTTRPFIVDRFSDKKPTK